MKARDIMSRPVITTTGDATVQDVARLLLKHRISAVPVVDDAGAMIGIITEGDLLHRAEAGTERRRSWWVKHFAGHEALASEYVKSHARAVRDVMTPVPIVTASPETPVWELAMLMDKHSINRVPILEAGQLVGIVSRANLLQVLASRDLETSVADEEIRRTLLARLESQPWAHSWRLNVTVHEGVVDLWGSTDSEAERNAIRVAAENTPGVRRVNDNLVGVQDGPREGDRA
jgi:CBS domain-containing protein